MTISPDPELFKKNIAAIRRRFPAVAESFSSPEGQDPSFEILFDENSSGFVSARYRESDKYISLHSRFDPLREVRGQLKDDFIIKEGSRVVIFGFGLGYHISELEKIIGERGSLAVLIIDPLIFYHVLHHIDISAIVSIPNLTLVSDPVDMSRYYQAYFVDGVPYSDGLYFLLPAVKLARARGYCGDLIAAATASYSYRAPASDEYYSDITFFDIMKNVNTNILSNLPRMIDSPGIKQFTSFFHNSQAIIVAAGPSLDKDISFLKECADSYVVIAVASALPKLISSAIVPEIVVALDWGKQNADHLCRFPADAVLIMKPALYKGVLEENYPEYILAATGTFDGLTHIDPFFKNWGEIGGTATVYSTAFRAAVLLGFDRIVSVGRDFGFTGGKIHFNGYKEGGNFIAHNRVSTIDISGTRIETNGLFLENIKQIERDIFYDSNYFSYNCSSQGAMVRGEIIAEGSLLSPRRYSPNKNKVVDTFKKTIKAIPVDVSRKDELILMVKSNLVER